METNALTERRQQSSGMVEVASSRQAQEVQAAMVIAQKFPRDTNRAFSRVMEDCKRKTLASKAVYAYPRGGQTVSGPSIRLAEAIAKCYGNLDFGIIELEKKPSQGNFPGESTMMAYCWDLETNTRSTKVFTVAHTRDKNQNTANGSTKVKVVLTDERDIYEIAANYGARRLRSCILSVVPSDIVESAVIACKKTMAGGDGPLVDRIRAMIVYFKDFGVTQEMIEKKLGHALDATTEEELAELATIANSLKDGIADREDFFEISPTKEALAGPQEPEQISAPKSARSVKNHAPQSQEEAVKVQKQKSEESPPSTNPYAEENKDAEIAERKQLVTTLLSYQKALKLTNGQFTAEIGKYTKKQVGELANAELKDLCAVFEAQIQKESAVKNG